MHLGGTPLSQADMLIDLFITEGLFRPMTGNSSTGKRLAIWLAEEVFKQPIRRPPPDPANELLLRHQMAQLITDLTELNYDEKEFIESIRALLKRARSSFEAKSLPKDWQSFTGAQFNYALSRSAYLVFSRWTGADTFQFDQTLTDFIKQPNEACAAGGVNADSKLINRTSDSIYGDTFVKLEARFSESTSEVAIESDLQWDTPFADEAEPSEVSAVMEETATLDEEAPLDTTITNRQLAKFSQSQCLDRLKLSDSDLLSSLPSQHVKLCPLCFGRSLAERKRPVHDMTTYCQTCRTRVETHYGPYYYEFYTANPFVVLSRHRHALIHQLHTRYLAPATKVNSLFSVPPLPGSLPPLMPPASKTYFFSISSIDEETYKGLEAKYTEYFADYSRRKPVNSVIIQICSTGGSVYQMKRMISLINSHKEYSHVIGDVLYSAAFRLYFSLICPKVLTSHAVGMFHLARSVETVLESGHIVDYPTKNQSTESLEFCRAIGMTHQQIEQISAGQDIYFGYPDLTKLDKPMAASSQSEFQDVLPNNSQAAWKPSRK